MKYSLYLGVLAVTCLGVGAANGQPSGSLPQGNVTGPMLGMPEAPPPPTSDLSTAPKTTPSQPGQGATTANTGLNDYLNYLRPTGCCALLGRDGPVGSEVYFRSGASFSLGGGIFGSVFDTGYMAEGGIRSVFFKPRADFAWTVDVGLMSVWYHANSSEQATLNNFASTTSVLGQTPVTTIIPQFKVTPRSLNVTCFNLALGNEWYLLGESDPADSNWKWRAGWDAGGKIGTEKIELQEIKHRNGFVYGGMTAAHTDLEIPFGQVIFQSGVRLEYNYLANHILQRSTYTDLSLLSILFTTGVRY